MIDFGVDKSSERGDLHAIVASLYYMAPKVFEGVQDEKNDIWSLGVLMFVMLCGYLPFQGASKPEVILKIK